ncbi:TonB-dependent receptor plug domain-containing protein [Teichococcus vastitatis]|uniref:TonB-dependent receptor n=1 Tax=Teichococcus vastitatis TaxID=2307076 RepID=A0ABS9WAK4_9PROT|nr:TonB-dependent receptor [Pseudoroseomonas vastitatis]MCI0756331.1 TonB-dependent receptor [Pseudoroseomonas vastitatis]
MRISFVRCASALRSVLTMSFAIAGLLVTPLAASSQGLDHKAFEELFGEPVTTSATGKPQRASDVPVAMNIITAEQIRRSGAHDLAEVLARFTSLDVMQYGATDFNVTARGYAAPNTPRMLVLVNGRQVYRDDYGRVSWSNIPVQLSEIRQIEVVRGPNSALFGYNAGAGVINIITFDPAHERVSSLTTRIGNGQYREVSGAVTVPVGEYSGLRLSAGLRRERAWQGGYSSYETVFNSDQDPRRSQASADGRFQIRDGIRLSLDASYSRSVSGELQLPGIVVPWDLKSWSIRSGLTMDSASGLWEVSLYHNALDAALAGVPTNTQGVTVVQLSNTAKLGTAHILRPMLEFRRNDIAGSDGTGGDGSLLSVPNTRTSYNVLAAGMMWNWAIRPNLESTAALRYDQLSSQAEGYDAVAGISSADAAYERNWKTWSWNAGLVWKATEIDIFRLGAARGVVLPSDYDLSAYSPVPLLGLTVFGNPLLKPTTVDNYDLEYRRRVALIDGQASITGFFQNNRGINTSLGAFPSLVSQDDRPRLMPYGIGTSHAYGAEVSLTGKLQSSWDWGAEYRFTMVETDRNPSYADFSGASPKHLLSARGGWGIGRLRIDLYGRYATEMRGYRIRERGILPVEVGDYASLSGRVGLRVSEAVTAAMEANSILNERQRQSIGIDAERRVYFSLRAAF